MGGDLRGKRGTVPSKLLGGGDGTANIPPKFQKYSTKYKFIVLSTVHIVSCVVFIVLKLQYLVGNCLVFFLFVQTLKTLN